jgi:hypothetical protein
MYMRHARFVIADVGVTMRASNQPVHPGRIEAREASLMDCQSIAATEASNIGLRPAADGVAVRMTHREVRFPRRSSLLLGALPSAVPCARLHARQVLWEWGLSEVAEIAELLLTGTVFSLTSGTALPSRGYPACSETTFPRSTRRAAGACFSWKR